MLLLTLLATAQITASSPPPVVRSSARVSIQILQGARVEEGRTSEPHSRGVARVADTDGARRTIRLVEFQ